MCVVDGNSGLRAAVEATWPGVAVQRRTVHKLLNLERHAPKHAIEELRTASHEIVYAARPSAPRSRRTARLCARGAPEPRRSSRAWKEAGEELLTFCRFPASQWKCLRTTNAIERLHGEFRRRVKTQGSLPNAQAAELLLFGLLVIGQIRMRQIDGWRELATRAADAAQRAA